MDEKTQFFEDKLTFVDKNLELSRMCLEHNKRVCISKVLKSCLKRFLLLILYVLTGAFIFAYVEERIILFYNCFSHDITSELKTEDVCPNRFERWIISLKSGPSMKVAMEELLNHNLSDQRFAKMLDIFKSHFSSNKTSAEDNRQLTLEKGSQIRNRCMRWLFFPIVTLSTIGTYNFALKLYNL